MKSPISKQALVNAAITGTGILFGTGYVLAKTFAEGCKNAEAKIVHKLDNNYSEREVRRYRMQSYFDVHKKINDKVNEAMAQAEAVSRKLHKKDMVHQITLIDQEQIKPELCS